MNREIFNSIKDRLKDYKYTSFEYLEFESIMDYQLIEDSKELIIVYGYNEEVGINEVQWAANDANRLVKAVKELGSEILVSFIPRDWKESIKAQGFVEYGILREYWIERLEDIAIDNFEYEKLLPEEYSQASKVTMSCRWQSREFRGETKEWVEQWMKGEDINASACGTRDCTILVHREGLRVVGVVCIGIYGDSSKNGAVLWVREQAVMPEYQGRGIGKSLLLGALQYGRDHGAKRAFLMADECNTGALHLYVKIGFVPNMEDEQIDLIYEAK